MKQEEWKKETGDEGEKGDEGDEGDKGDGRNGRWGIGRWNMEVAQCFFKRIGSILEWLQNGSPVLHWRFKSSETMVLEWLRLTEWINKSGRMDGEERLNG